MKRTPTTHSNIKRAFLQPAESNSLQVLIHLQLHAPISLDSDAKKGKTSDYFQFYVEVVDASQDLTGNGAYRDEDGLMEEQEERRNRNRWNERFRKFCKKVEVGTESLAHKVEFDIPYKKLAFTGVPNKQVVEIMPSVNSLIALEDTPPLVLPMKEVELASFERVNFNLREFDLVFVFTDFSKPVVRIDSIPTKRLGDIKEWLNSIEILCFESGNNYKWKQLLKKIESTGSSREEFYKDGGWSTVLGGPDEDEEGEEDEEEEESEYEPEEGSDFEDEEEDSEEYESDEEEDDEDDESEFEEEDEGEDWDELEMKAKEQDSRAAQEERAREREERNNPKPAKRKAPSSSSSSSSKKSKSSSGQPKKKQRK